jgi:hypothetical protein
MEQIDDAFKAGWAAHSHSLLAQWFAEWELILPPDARESFRNDLMPSVGARDSAPSQAPSEPVKDCHTCKHQHNAGSKGACKTCTRLWAEVNGGRWDNWESQQ